MIPTQPDGRPNPYELAQSHLERAQVAAFDPIDWADLTIYGFYCLEVGVKAAAEHVGARITNSHAQKADLARQLSVEHNLPDVSALLADLNQARKATSYGDVALPQIDSDDLVAELEEFLAAVGELLDRDFASDH